MSWKKVLKTRLQENIEKVGLSATYASLSTVRLDNTPAVRTVVIRGFLGEHYKEETGYSSEILMVTTDRRSQKVKEIENNPNTEINWYMNGDMSQFRIRGQLHILHKGFQGLKWQEIVERTSGTSGNSLSFQAFQRHKEINPWEAERLRQFILFDAKMRAEMTNQESYKSLEIEKIDENGWFRNEEYQELLEEAFDNFTLLLIQVKSVGYWSPSKGLRQLL